MGVGGEGGEVCVCVEGGGGKRTFQEGGTLGIKVLYNKYTFVLACLLGLVKSVIDCILR